jgi:hypothetical protein
VIPDIPGSFSWFVRDPDLEPEAVTEPEPVPEPQAQPQPVAVAPVTPVEPEQRGSLNRRVRGAQLPEGALGTPVAAAAAAAAEQEAATTRPAHNADAVREAMDVFQEAFARAASAEPAAAAAPPDWPPRHEPAGVNSPLPQRVPAPPPPPMMHPPGGGGQLSRRTPGANLAPGLRDTPSAPPPPRPVSLAPQRDPEAERSAFDGWTAALAKAEEQTSSE